MPTVRVKTVEVVKLTDYNEFVNHGKCSIELIEGKGSYEIYENQQDLVTLVCCCCSTSLCCLPPWFLLPFVCLGDGVFPRGLPSDEDDDL